MPCEFITIDKLDAETRTLGPWSLLPARRKGKKYGERTPDLITFAHIPLAISRHIAIPVRQRCWEMRSVAGISPLCRETRFLVGS